MCASACPLASRTIYPAFACFLDGAAAITDDESPKIQRYHGGYSADNGGCALQCIIRNLKGEKFFVSLGDVSVSDVAHGISCMRRPLTGLNNDCCQKVLLPVSQ